VARHVEGDRALRALGLALPPVLALYALFDRGFAYIHIPRTPVFPGEVVVGLALLVVATALYDVAVVAGRGSGGKGNDDPMVRFSVGECVRLPRTYQNE
jgi:hypothetical protein